MTDPAQRQSVSTVLSREQLVQLPGEWVASERLRVRRCIVTETVSVPVVVQREELLIERLPVTGTAGPPGREPAHPLVVLLHARVPVITLESRPYEQVTITVVRAAGEQPVKTTLGSERIEVLTDEAGGQPAMPTAGS